ncbi:MAG TPA: ATP-binding cassette domain-containing protein [Prolixibacteraceae bacterium]|jgi:zinc transport system ATP-binding protein|nr:ATP-binding cassette domain-containing protein [Prolixibacteraceae bacterium]NLS98358.1 ATP-binding cassette domain-containing protein [Bacteroidales bacterium]OQB79354.1 MAG: High-affinity zinc uptake system ATP-binding protein ZnuC [Bacteroidetes bacterium ADurb.Bin123]HNZ69891.1 ATP-binding cassette domain-containing protein [Prolixibacteraceae bacterium]HOC87485.1 ATP-binding cassette domain-containing protein [Prolixibacteraceae bacterium]
MMEKPLIHINHVTFSWDVEPVLEDVDLKIYDRDFIGIIGPNGGGKTTLVKIIMGLIQPLKGKVYFREDLPRLKRPIGYLPQVKTLDKQFPITVIDVVRSGSLMRHNPFSSASEEKERALELLGEMGIGHLRKRAAGELSGGQMQRVFLCRALISDPRVLILDEPGTFVDNRFEGEFFERLKALNEKMAILLVSHDVGTITSFVKTIACVNRKLHYHHSAVLTPEDLKAYNCPIQVISHGDIPHTILEKHNGHA